MSYPEPPQGVFGSTPMDLGLSPESYASYPPRPSHASHEFATTMGYDANGAIYAETPYMYNAKSSPGMYPDDSDMRVPSSNLSITSGSSSNMGSPLSNHGQLAPIPEWAAPQSLGVTPGIVDQNDYFPGSEYSFAPGAIEGYNTPFEFANTKGPGFVDPSLIHPDVRTMAMPGFEQPYQAPNSAYPASPSASPQLRSGNTSPFMHTNNYQPYSHSPFQPPPVDPQRRPSLVSFHSNYSGDQTYSGDESKERQKCSYPDCGKTFKDLKAHMLTHQTERPEKCPIATCEYHIKGFARKYDKNRHTLTHYKGTMVCGFCPGSGSAAEKSFNRADVFKRHLTAVHGVEQTPPNSRKKAGTGVSGNGAKKLTGYAPDATGKCSTCSQTFSNAQDFYEHLDDCVLRIVQQEDPAEAINAKRLAEVENDRDVHNTLEKNHLPTTTTMTTSIDDDDDDDMDEDDMADEDFKAGRGLKSATSPTKRNKGNPPNGVQKSRGLTHSRGGVPLLTKNRGRKNRRDYPSSWGFDKGQMNMKKRVMAVFDGPRRLAKDDMMLSTEHEVRVKLTDGKSYVTDLDIQTLKRAAGFHDATEEEKGPWISDDPTEEDLKQMLKFDVEATAQH
ncbi:hypothetical protein B0T25DRAFT_588258 [Lasiosphaeria hispida]|uniref:C2H2-type domain-containing protein n=1 Tax=Lasiosphaeria hispida TaxID=260671 RepID=A0AAJ0HQ24_9PEZI|nr:hypothetical protein B0T25DRAFT_588258 [Lasiosphaeria hispida]